MKPQATSREAILAECRAIVRHQGLSGISVRTVAAAAGVATGTLYHYFPDKRALHICHRSAEDRAGTLNWLRLNPIGSIGLTLARSSISSLECSSGNANKTTGLSEICSRIGISMAEVVYVGDAETDLEAMSASGCAVAMGNALPDVKGKADLVVRDNDHDGIVDAIEALF